MNAATSIVPTDAPSVFEVLNSLTTLQRQAIVRANNPPPGFAGFLFDIPEDDEVSLRSEITNNFLEDNTVVIDQIGILPEEVSVRGLVAEIVALAPSSSSPAKVANPLPDNPALTPALAPQAQQEADAAFFRTGLALAGLQSSGSLWDFFLARAPQPPSQTKQARAFLYFYGLWKARELFTVETPWGFFTDMAIESLRASQDDETRFRSSFAIKFKKIRTSRVATITVGQLAGRANLQGASVTNNGTAGQAPLSTSERESLLYRLAHPGP